MQVWSYIENPKDSTRKLKGKWTEQSSKIQSQHRKISCISIHKQWAIFKGNYVSISNSIKKNRTSLAVQHLRLCASTAGDGGSIPGQGARIPHATWCSQRKRIKYLGINLTNEVKDLYNENYKTLLKETKDISKWKHIPCLWIGSLTIVKISLLSQKSTDSMQSLSKSPWHFVFTENSEIIWNLKGPRIAKTILKKTKKTRGLTLPDFKTYYKATTVIKIAKWRQTYRPMAKNRKPKNKPSYTWSNDIWQGCQDHSMRKEQSFQQMVLGKLDIHMQKNEVGPLPNNIHKN